MLRFITKRTVPRRTAFCFCNKAFVDKIMHFRLADMRPEEILSEIDSFSSASSLVTAQSKLFIQLNSLLQGKELEQAKEVYLKRAIELFSHRGAFGQNGELLRQFIVKNQVSKLFSPELDRLFVEQTFLRLVKEGRDQELAAISLDAYINILESCVFNDLFDPEEIHHCTVYALQKVKFAERQVRPLGNLVVTHSLVLKKYKGRVPEATYSKLVESLLSVFNQTLHTLKNASFEESFDAILLATHINSCVEVFNGHSKQQVFEATWEIIELEFSQFIKKHSNKLINYIQEGEEGELLPLVEELNQAGSLYKNDTLKIHLLPAIENRLEVNYRKTSTSLVAQLINLAFKLESNFQVAPKYLSSLKVSKNDPVTSLQNASVTLDIFAKQQLGESLGPYMDQLQDFLIELLANPETKRSQLQVRLLLAVFKQLVQLGRGSIQLFKAYFEFFKQREVLEQVGLMSVLVQFLPALGLKTKKLAGAMTNTNDDQTSNVINVSQAINNQVRPSLTEQWKALDEFITSKLSQIELEKLPSVVIQFVYGQIVVRDLQIFKQTALKLKGNMGRLSAKQLAQSIYTLARVNLPYIGEMIAEGTVEFMKKTRNSPKEYSQERVAVLWSNAKSGVLDIELFIDILKLEIPNIKSYNERVFVQLINAVGTLSPTLDSQTLNNLLEQVLSFLEKHGRQFQLQVTLGCAYHLLLFPQSKDSKALYDKIFNELSHLVGSQQKFLMQNFMLIYYLYLLLCHRSIRGAPAQELNRYNQILVKHQSDILHNYANSKKSTVSNAELRFKEILETHREKLAVDAIAEDQSRVLESGKMNWLMLPASKVRTMIERQESLKEFTTKCLLVPYSIDILAGNLAFEVNGPFHYVKDSKTNQYQMNGHTKLKKEFIEALGLQYIEIPFWNLDELFVKNADAQAAEIKNYIQKGSSTVQQ